MADVFLSYSRASRAQAEAVASALEASGRSTSWERQAVSGEGRSLKAEQDVAEAGCVVVAWSKTARDSLRVRAEACEALDLGKLVQINLDGTRVPLPFAKMHWLDFSAWPGTREHLPWPQLEKRIGALLGDGERAEARLDLDAIAVEGGGEPALQGLGKVASLGFAALALALLLAAAVLMVALGTISAAMFDVFSWAAVAVSAALLLACAFLVFRIVRASRR
jgi:hypothetical protein